MSDHGGAGPDDAMTSFVEIPKAYLADISTESDRIPTLYYAGNFLVRRVFWQRLYLLNWMINRRAGPRRRCLDFGGGSGIMLPTLAAHFETVTLIDLEAEQARKIVDKYRLDNVEIVEADILQTDLGAGAFDAIVAADVLEHFKELPGPVQAIGKWLAPEGALFTSLPTESTTYALLRLFFGVEKPWDHYHTGYEVEAYLASQGFVRTRRVTAPLILPITPLYLISSWRLGRANQ
jgi:predicted TPR repeat methyltransferase